MLAVYKKEMRAYFTSIIGYLFLAFFLALIGLYFYVVNLVDGSPNVGQALSTVCIFFILLVPMVTMRSMAEENKQKTDQLLYTSPVSITKIILGKYLSILSMLGIVMLIVCTYPIILSKFGNVNMKQAYISILAFFLMGAVYMAIGLFISAITESQAFAAIMTFVIVIVSLFAAPIAGMLPTTSKAGWLFMMIVVLLLAWITYFMMRNAIFSIALGLFAEIVLFIVFQTNAEMFEGAIVDVCSWVSVVERYANFVFGELDISAIVYYISFSALFVFLTIQAIKKRRWS